MAGLAGRQTLQKQIKRLGRQGFGQAFPRFTNPQGIKGGDGDASFMNIAGKMTETAGITGQTALADPLGPLKPHIITDGLMVDGLQGHHSHRRLIQGLKIGQQPQPILTIMAHGQGRGPLPCQQMVPPILVKRQQIVITAPRFLIKLQKNDLWLIHGAQE